MKKIKIKAPVNSLKGAKMQIDAGAGELYCGFEYSYLKTLTFSGRGKTSCFDGKNTLLSYEDFIKTVDMAHKNQVKVELVANVPSLTDCNFYGNNDTRKKYLDYVKMGERAGIDRIIVGDLGNLLFLKEQGIETPITASTFFGCLNRYSISMLKDIGIEKVVLPHHLSLDEIKHIVDSTNIEVEVFGHFGCSFLEGTCGLLHINNDVITTGIPCRAKFKVEKSKDNINILDMNEDCSLCQLQELMNIGVDSVKTIGRDLDAAYMANITAVYSLAIDMLMDGLSKQSMLELLKEEIDFSIWQEAFCDQNRCKYSSNNYYV